MTIGRLAAYGAAGLFGGAVGLAVALRGHWGEEGYLSHFDPWFVAAIGAALCILALANLLPSKGDQSDGHSD